MPLTVNRDAPVTIDLDLTVDLQDHAVSRDASNLQRRSDVQDGASSTFNRSHIGESLAAPQLEALHQAGQAREKELPLAPGRILLDRYVLTQILGTGGDCTVFRARDLEADANGSPGFVAVKTPRPDHPNPSRARERLQREYEHARGLVHSGIVQVFSLEQDGDILFMTMELLQGETLGALVRRHGGTLPGALTRRLLKSAADALAYSHAAGIVHGDFNLANAFVVGGDRVRLIDLGTARAGTQHGVSAATPAYASPQVLEGSPPTKRDDIFSFACVAYELLAGRHPFNGMSSTDAQAAGVRPQPPEQLSAEQALALMAALGWDSEARPEDIRSFAESIAPQPQRRRTVIEEHDLDIEPLATPADDKRWWIFGGVCVVAIVVAVLVTRFA